MSLIAILPTRIAQLKWLHFLFSGYCFYQSSKCGICVSLGQRYDRRKHHKRTGTSSYCSYLPISKLQVNSFWCYKSIIKLKKGYIFHQDLIEMHTVNIYFLFIATWETRSVIHWSLSLLRQIRRDFGIDVWPLSTNWAIQCCASIQNQPFSPKCLPNLRKLVQPLNTGINYESLIPLIYPLD